MENPEHSALLSSRLYSIIRLLSVLLRKVLYPNPFSLFVLLARFGPLRDKRREGGKTHTRGRGQGSPAVGLIWSGGKLFPLIGRLSFCSYRRSTARNYGECFALASKASELVVSAAAF